MQPPNENENENDPSSPERQHQQQQIYIPNSEANERHRRARTLRIIMLFIMTLVLMDDSQIQESQRLKREEEGNIGIDILDQPGGGGGEGNGNGNGGEFKRRVGFSRKVDNSLKSHYRRRSIYDFNYGLTSNSSPSTSTSTNSQHPHQLKFNTTSLPANAKLRHYPLNATGYYSGTWSNSLKFEDYDTRTARFKNEERFPSWYTARVGSNGVGGGDVTKPNTNTKPKTARRTLTLSDNDNDNANSSLSLYEERMLNEKMPQQQPQQQQQSSNSQSFYKKDHIPTGPGVYLMPKEYQEKHSLNFQDYDGIYLHLPPPSTNIPSINTPSTTSTTDKNPSTKAKAKPEPSLSIKDKDKDKEKILQTTLKKSSGSLSLTLQQKHVTGLSSLSLLRGLLHFHTSSPSTSINGLNSDSVDDSMVYLTGVYVGGSGRISMVGNTGEGQEGGLILNDGQGYGHGGKKSKNKIEKENEKEKGKEVDSARTVRRKLVEEMDSEHGWSDFFTTVDMDTDTDMNMNMNDNARADNGGNDGEIYAHPSFPPLTAIYDHTLNKLGRLYKRLSVIYDANANAKANANDDAVYGGDYSDGDGDGGVGRRITEITVFKEQKKKNAVVTGESEEAKVKDGDVVDDIPDIKEDEDEDENEKNKKDDENMSDSRPQAAIPIPIPIPLPSTPLNQSSEPAEEPAEDEDEDSETPYTPPGPLPTHLHTLPLSLFPYPSNTLQTSTPQSKRYLKNSGGCEFQVSLDSAYEELTAGAWERENSVREQLKVSSGSLKGTRVKLSYITQLTGDVYSANCNVNYNITLDAVRVDMESFNEAAGSYSAAMTVVCLIQVYCTLRQLSHTSLNASARNVSITCIGMQAVLDSIATIFHIVVCVFMQDISTFFFIVVFLKMILASVIQLKYMNIIMTSRMGSNVTTEEMRRVIAVLDGKFYLAFFLTITTFITFHASSPLISTLTLHSFYLPQILLNIQTETRHPFHPHYTIGMSLTRLFTPLYLYAYPSNFVAIAVPGFNTDSTLTLAVCAWVALQVCALQSQSKYGARWFVPRQFLPVGFDWGGEVPERMLGDGRDIEAGKVKEEGGEESDEESSLDCVICYSRIDISDRKNYMLAPCDHCFHRTCLETWMEIKRECPICRTQLPTNNN